jgi:hypothetical protein
MILSIALIGQKLGNAPNRYCFPSGIEARRLLPGDDRRPARREDYFGLHRPGQDDGRLRQGPHRRRLRNRDRRRPHAASRPGEDHPRHARPGRPPFLEAARVGADPHRHDYIMTATGVLARKYKEAALKLLKNSLKDGE